MKTILVILDGLSYVVAYNAMGYLHGECTAGRGRLYSLTCELPSLSRPLYECILTGVPPVRSGVVHNEIIRLSHHRSIFHFACAAGLTTAAAAYHWVSELYKPRTLQRRGRQTHAGASAADSVRAFLSCGSLPGFPRVRGCRKLAAAP